MAIRKIASIGHPVLRKVARDLSDEELASSETQGFIRDLVETMRDANGAGLAANQIYQPIRICAIEVADNPRYPYKPNIPLTVLVNPRIEPLSEETFENFEGCLSVPNLRGVVRRFAEIRVRAITPTGKPVDEVIRGITAGTYQHEVDHLDGKLFVDGVEDPRTLCTWQEFDRHYRADVVHRTRELVDKWGS